VHRGDLLLELDSRTEQLQLDERRAEQAGLAPRLERLRARIGAERGAMSEERIASRFAAEEAARRAEEARIGADTAEADALRFRRLRTSGVISVRELERAEADARMRSEAAAELAIAEERLPREQRVRDKTRDAHLAELEGELAGLVARRGAIEAEVARLRYEIERRTIRAPVDGRIGEAAIIRPGTVIDEAQPLGSIVPEGSLSVVAQYPARTAVGRIEPGQRAILRLDAFPWAEFGVVGATVTQVAREIRDGRVRVELALDPVADFRGRLDHGMPGSIEVTVERISPLHLILRSAGRWLARQP
jgi:membrane fusion protein (multidrug efflux system)